jgi:membrane-bound serine protease (ClpP class)
MSRFSVYCSVILAIALVWCIPICTADTHLNSDVWICSVQDTINPMVSEYLRDMISRAEQQDVECLIIELDTPGGVLETTHKIVQSELNADIPIVVYVAPHGARAASAGMFITIAAHIAAMAPATNIGAAHPVTLGPSQPQKPDLPDPLQMPAETEESDKAPQSSGMMDGSAMEHKIMNDTLAWARTIAKNRDRNLDWVESAIVDSISSTEHEALEAGVIDLIAGSRAELIEALDGRVVSLHSREVTLDLDRVNIIEKPMTYRQKLLSALINPTIAIYLLFGGLIGLYIELTHPGFILPGVIGAISLILALFAMHTLPINYAGLFLLLISFAFFIAEVKVQSYGILTIGGIVALLLGASMLVDSELPGMEVSMGAILPLAISVAVITLFLVTLVVKSHARKPVTGHVGMIGLIGTVKTELNPDGQIFIHGELWQARSNTNQTISVGSAVKVLSLENLTLIVQEVENINKEEIP